ncbi:hypothetical protein Q8A73_001495 [Channa argus]|nr:hypothetical protein Q8A73_001495 [Channa argus]
MRVCSIYFTLALGLGGFAQEVSQAEFFMLVAGAEMLPESIFYPQLSLQLKCCQTGTCFGVVQRADHVQIISVYIGLYSPRYPRVPVVSVVLADQLQLHALLRLQMLGWPPHDGRVRCVSCWLKVSHVISRYRFSGGEIHHLNRTQQMSKKRKSPDDQDFEESSLAGCSDTAWTFRVQGHAKVPLSAPPPINHHQSQSAPLSYGNDQLSPVSSKPNMYFLA